MRSSTPCRLFAVLACLALLTDAGAAPAAMKLPVELQSAPPLDVTGRTGMLWRNPLAFGEWQSSAPGRFDASGWSLAAADRAGGERRIGTDRVAFEFRLRRAGAAEEALSQCLARGRFASQSETRGRVTDQTTVEPPGYPRLECRLRAAGDGVLILARESLSQRESGILRFGDREWTLRSVNLRAGQRSSLAMGRFGYEVRSGEAAVAAVETVNRGRVWLREDLGPAERQELATALMALLNYSVLHDTQEP